LFVLLILIEPPAGMEGEAWATAALGVFMAVWWITEAIPIAATALLPIVLIPLLGIGDVEDAASPYASPVIFLFMGGFMLAQAVQRWGLHRRVALHLIRVIGTEPGRIVAGFMVATAFLSMWVSNTATAVLMLPIGLSLIDLVIKRSGRGQDEVGDFNFAIALMLGIAYAASIGGAATLIGTPPNALLAGFLSDQYGYDLGFGQWMLVGVPLMILMLPLTWWILTRWIFRIGIERIEGGREMIAEEIEKLGRASRGEKFVAGVFVAAAVSWVTRPLLENVIPGLSDAGIAVAVAVVLFALPVRLSEGRFALDWESASGIPWNVLVLFGGGLSLAAAIADTGLADWIGASLEGVGAWPVIPMLIAITLVIIFITEISSNTASAAAFLPVLAALAISIGQDPLLLAIPAALGASCAFMLPVATPPNAIVYGSSFITIPHMARAGIVLNVLFAIAIPLVCYALLAALFGVEVGAVPSWAR
jgi:solute carrier family 13 (sodium-dependent dicarboxylate transporter), member 2/3/5